MPCRSIEAWFRFLPRDRLQPALERRQSGNLTLAVVCWSTDQHKAPVAIAAIDITLFVDLQKDPRMAQSRRNITAAIAGYAGFADADGFGFIFGHSARLAKGRAACNGPVTDNPAWR
jgi:hypothetical protein